MKKNQNLFGTCDLKDADIAFFPMLNHSMSSSLHMKISNQRIAGVVELPPVVSNRVKLYWDNGKTFTPSNVPLHFTIIDSACNYSPESIDVWYAKLMFFIQKNGFPATWIIGPDYFLQYIQKSCKDWEGAAFYYHRSVSAEERHYFALTSSDKIRIYPVRENVLFALS